MGKLPKKKRFEVQENESIDDCLDRMKQEGYVPIRRMEEPIFQEVIVGNEKKVEPIGRKIVFEGILKQ